MLILANREIAQVTVLLLNITSDMINKALSLDFEVYHIQSCKFISMKSFTLHESLSGEARLNDPICKCQSLRTPNTLHILVNDFL